jgi:hypothetical protein
MREDFSDAERWPDQLFLRISHQAELPLVVPLSRFRFIRLCRQADSQTVTHSACSPAKMRALASSQEKNRFWISVVLVQAHFDYRFFLFSKFPVIEPRFTIKFINLARIPAALPH